jgi:hypothetical protein
MRQKYALHIAPPHTDLGQALQRASPGVEHELLISSLHQCARPEAVHDRRRATCAQQSDFDLLPLSGVRRESEDDKGHAEASESREGHVRELDEDMYAMWE